MSSTVINSRFGAPSGFEIVGEHAKVPVTSKKATSATRCADLLLIEDVFPFA
jgi:hypothetical protein